MQQWKIARVLIKVEKRRLSSQYSEKHYYRYTTSPSSRKSDSRFCKHRCGRGSSLCIYVLYLFLSELSKKHYKIAYTRAHERKKMSQRGSFIHFSSIDLTWVRTGLEHSFFIRFLGKRIKELRNLISYSPTIRKLFPLNGKTEFQL